LEDHRASGLHDAAEWYARRTGRLAGATLETEIEVTCECRCGFDVAIGERSQQVDTAPRRVGLDPELKVSWAFLKAEATVDAADEVILRRRVVDRWRSGHARSVPRNGPD